MPELAVEERSHGWRLDRFVRDHLPGMPLSHIFKLFRKGKVRLDGKKAAAAARVAAGQIVIVHVPEERFNEDAEAQAPAARGRILPPFPIEVVYEDGDLIAVNKPAGFPVHPGSGYAGGTCIDQILEHLGHVRSSGTFAPALLHRLDADTSGVLVTAKTYRALRGLSKEFSHRRVEKRYRALAGGAPVPDEGRIDVPVKRLDNPQRVREDRQGVTDYRVIARAARPDLAANGWPMHLALLDLQILTGRTHQIRSHLKSIGAPVIGDALYGAPPANEAAKRDTGLSRQFLHAARLVFTHPVSGLEIGVEAPLPADLRKTLDFLGLPAA